MNIKEILALQDEQKKIDALKEKSIIVPEWNGIDGLINEYEPKYHPVMDKSKYRDSFKNGNLEKVTRITLNFQKLATKRMTELICGIPVKRIYKPKNDRQKEIATYIEEIFKRNRIGSLNIERCNMLFSCCEVMTLWYATEERNNIYGFNSPLKLRCRNLSPKSGDMIYPLFDEYGDMIALSVGYERKEGNDNIKFFDTYTDSKHLKWGNKNGTWEIIEDEDIKLGKIPAAYVYRPEPIWEDSSNNVYEMEWSLSRNGNYLRKNSKPIFAVFTDEVIKYGDEEQNSDRAVLQFPHGSNAQYVTWAQAVDNLKFQIDTLRSLYFTQLQLPDWSYEKMSQQALSGESRKQLFIDCQLKVIDESGRLLEFFDREVNVVKAFLKIMLGESYHDDIDSLKIENLITPFSIDDEKETIDNLLAANGNEPIISQRESIVRLGWSDDPDKTIKEINGQGIKDVFDLTE